MILYRKSGGGLGDSAVTSLLLDLLAAQILPAVKGFAVSRPLQMYSLPWWKGPVLYSVI